MSKSKKFSSEEDMNVRLRQAAGAPVVALRERPATNPEPEAGGSFDAGARTPTPPPPPSMNELLREAVYGKRDG